MAGAAGEQRNGLRSRNGILAARSGPAVFISAGTGQNGGEKRMYMRPSDRPAYSFRQDPQVPAFDDARLLVVLDGACGLCSATARRIARLDRDDRVRLCTAQSPLGQGLMVHYGFAPDDPDSWLLIEDGHAFGGLEGACRLFPQLNRAYLPMRVLRILPRGLQDWLYARVARNRYRFFGTGDLCGLPDQAVRHRLIG